MTCKVTCCLYSLQIGRLDLSTLSGSLGLEELILSENKLVDFPHNVDTTMPLLHKLSVAR